MWGDGGPYGSWAGYLERWQKDLSTAEGILPVLAQEDFAPETWVRLTNRIIDALNSRMCAWSEALTADLGQASNEFSAGRALTQARVGLVSFQQLADHPGLPGDLRQRLCGLVEQQIRSTQQALEQSLERQVTSGGPREALEARRRTVRDNPLTAVLAASDGQRSPGGAPGSSDPWAYDPTMPARRTLAL